MIGLLILTYVALVMDKWHCNENNSLTDHHKCPDYAACIFGVCVVRECQVETGKKSFPPLECKD